MCSTATRREKSCWSAPSGIRLQSWPPCSPDPQRRGRCGGKISQSVRDEWHDPMDYFIDESGNTGDLANGNLPSNFGDQPIFCLAAIGIADERLLKIEIDRLKAMHRV